MKYLLLFFFKFSLFKFSLFVAMFFFATACANEISALTDTLNDNSSNEQSVNDSADEDDADNSADDDENDASDNAGNDATDNNPDNSNNSGNSDNTSHDNTDENAHGSDNADNTDSADNIDEGDNTGNSDNNSENADDNVNNDDADITDATDNTDNADDNVSPGENGEDDSQNNSSGDGTYHVDSIIDPASPASGFLHVDGNRLVDDNGNTAKLTGVNWFGFETGNLAPHGLWARDYRSMMQQIADMGFNTVRIPWCNAMLRDGAATQSINTYGADPYNGNDPMNGDLEDKSPIEVMDAIIDAAGEAGLKIMLDNHSRNPDGYMEEDLWYTSSTSESQWVEDWVFMAKRYKGNTTVIAFDLNNEPHDDASWGTGNEATDWNVAAEKCGIAIQQVNPDVLIVIEGVEEAAGTGYWWGGNLAGVKDNPIELSIQEKLVYSAHEYGPEVHLQPWFEESDFPDNMDSIWYDHFGFIVENEQSHMFIGEFGVKDPASQGGVAGVWFDKFLNYMNSSDGFSWTFWSLNPNSGDTEGILTYDWVTPLEWKLEALKPFMAPMIK